MKERILAYLHDVLMLLAPYIVNSGPPECTKSFGMDKLIWWA